MIVVRLPPSLAEHLGMLDTATIHVPKAADTEAFIPIELRDVSEDDETIHYRVHTSDIYPPDPRDDVDALQTLARFAEEAPGRLPNRVVEAIKIANRHR